MITSNPQAYEVWLGENGRARFGYTHNQRGISPTHLAYFARIAQANTFVRAYNRKVRAEQIDEVGSYFSGCQTITFEPR